MAREDLRSRQGAHTHMYTHFNPRKLSDFVPVCIKRKREICWKGVFAAGNYISRTIRASINFFFFFHLLFDRFGQFIV